MLTCPQDLQAQGLKDYKGRSMEASEFREDVVKSGNETSAQKKSARDQIERSCGYELSRHGCQSQVWVTGPLRVSLKWAECYGQEKLHVSYN